MNTTGSGGTNREVQRKSCNHVKRFWILGLLKAVWVRVLDGQEGSNQDQPFVEINDASHG